MFWHVPGFSAASPVSACSSMFIYFFSPKLQFFKHSFYVFQVDTILDKENFKLEDLLDEDEIIQECKALNTRLINLYCFFSRALLHCGCPFFYIIGGKFFFLVMN
jgi:serine/threonine-protein phosphatase 6 regulatory subunit 3